MKKGKTNEPFELKKLRAEVCLRQHKKPVWILMGAVFLVLVYLNYSTIVAIVNMVNNLDSTKIGVLGTLLGALIGGIMTLFGSVWVNSKQQKAKKYIMRKNLIYSPLYDELVKKKEEAFSKKRYPEDVQFVRDERKLINLVEFSAWERIKSDTRYLEVPDELVKQMDLFVGAVKHYVSTRNAMKREVDGIIKAVFQENGEPPCQLAGAGEYILSSILSGKDENLYKLICAEKHKTSISKKIDAEIRKKVKESPKANELETAYQSWQTIQDQTIRFLGLMIKQIIVKYEE